MAKGLNELSAAYRTRQAMRSIAKKVLYEEYPRPRYGTVNSVSIASRTCAVEYPDETGSYVDVGYGGIVPEVGSVVRVAGPIAGRYIDDVLTGFASVGRGAWTIPDSDEVMVAPWVVGNIGSERDAQYRREGDLVRLRGLVSTPSFSGLAASVMVLPEGHEPPEQEYLMAYSYNSSASPEDQYKVRPFRLNTSGGILLLEAMGADSWINFANSWSVST